MFSIELFACVAATMPANKFDALTFAHHLNIFLSPLFSIIIIITILVVFLTHHTLCHRTELRTLPTSRGHGQWDC